MPSTVRKVDPSRGVDVGVDGRAHDQVTIGAALVAGDHRPVERHGRPRLVTGAGDGDPGVDGFELELVDLQAVDLAGLRDDLLEVELGVEHGLGRHELETGAEPHDRGIADHPR